MYATQLGKERDGHCDGEASEPAGQSTAEASLWQCRATGGYVALVWWHGLACIVTPTLANHGVDHHPRNDAPYRHAAAGAAGADSGHASQGKAAYISPLLLISILLLLLI